jgi:hypothetical protein
VFPPLADCRKRFDELIQGSIDWGSSGSGFFDIDEWEKTDPDEIKVLFQIRAGSRFGADLHEPHFVGASHRWAAGLRTNRGIRRPRVLTRHNGGGRKRYRRGRRQAAGGQTTTTRLRRSKL